MDFVAAALVGCRQGLCFGFAHGCGTVAQREQVVQPFAQGAILPPVDLVQARRQHVGPGNAVDTLKLIECSHFGDPQIMAATDVRFRFRDHLTGSPQVVGQTQKGAVAMLCQNVQPQGRQTVDFRHKPVMIMSCRRQQQMQLAVEMFLQAQQSVMRLIRRLRQQLMIGDLYHAGEDSTVRPSIQPICDRLQAHLNKTWSV